MTQNIPKYIKHLLYNHECVIVSGLGAFIAHNESSIIDEKKNYFSPNKKSISFNSEIKKNDGLLAKKLTHPKYNVPKIYHVTLNKPLKNKYINQLKKGIKLEDGLVKIDSLDFLDKNKSKVKLKIHIGKNRIIRRIFKFINYNVIELDRVSFSFLNKVDLKVGKWRSLKLIEVERLKE